MPSPVNTLTSNITSLLHDAGNVRWVLADLITWLNAGQLAIIRRIPAAYPKTSTEDLVAGTLQTIPSDGLAFIRAVHNVSAADKPLAAPRLVSHMLLDTEDPDWHAATTSKIVRSYTHSPETPKEFWTTPPQPTAAGRLRIQYSAVPPTAVSGGDLAIDKTYDNALINYALFRAFDRDSEDADDTRSAKSFAAFEADLA